MRKINEKWIKEIPSAAMTLNFVLSEVVPSVRILALSTRGEVQRAKRPIFREVEPWRMLREVYLAFLNLTFIRLQYLQHPTCITLYEVETIKEMKVQFVPGYCEAMRALPSNTSNSPGRSNSTTLYVCIGLTILSAVRPENWGREDMFQKRVPYTSI
jgi:hypothetical protein